MKKAKIIMAIGMVAFFATAALATEQQVQANILHDLGDGVENYRQGAPDGRGAGARGEYSECPYTDLVYCVGWNGGYSDGERSRGIVDQANGNDNDNDDDEDDD